MSGKELLLVEISEAFKGVELDGGIGLSEADAMDSYRDEHFREVCRQKDEKHDWAAISATELNRCYCGLSYFDAKGMKFHLPAFMVAFIEGVFRFDLLLVLTDVSANSKLKFDLLTPGQRKAVKSFLEFLYTHPDYHPEKNVIEAALKSFWGK